MQAVTEDATVVVDAVRALDVPGPRVRVVGVSGFGGSGKSTLAGHLAAALPGTVVVAGDDLLLQRPPIRRTSDWDVVDRGRLRREVLEPAHRGEPVTWRDTVVAPGGVLVVEGLGLFLPELLDLFDLTVWVDVDLATATARGRWRDRHVHGNEQAELWQDVWAPNDRDFRARYRPDEVADLRYRPPALAAPPAD